MTWALAPENDINDGNSTYNPKQSAYCFTPILPEGYTLPEGVALPEIWVMIGETMLLAAKEDMPKTITPTEIKDGQTIVVRHGQTLDLSNTQDNTTKNESDACKIEISEFGSTGEKTTVTIIGKGSTKLNHVEIVIQENHLLFRTSLHLP